VSHLLLMVVHAGLVAMFFAFLTRERTVARLRAFLFIFFGMLAGALALAWLMFPYPVQGAP
jgi:hypothetical protein